MFDTKTVNVSDSYKVPPERLFEVLREQSVSIDLFQVYIVVQLVQAWSNGSAKWDFRESGSFALFGGNATGTFVKIVRTLVFVF